MATTTTTTTAYPVSASAASSRPGHTRSKTWAPMSSLSRSSSSSSLTVRPPSRHYTTTSTGWYNTDEENWSLEKIAERLNTFAGRFERFMGLCATNVVMALFRPTPLVIFLFHPLLLIVWGLLAAWWMAGWVSAG